jgi:protein involved in temperature-dependent protein secretion
MQDADECLKSGDLKGARAALVEALRAQPNDPRTRIFFFQLLAILGEWDKAETQVRALAQVTPDAQMLATVYGLAIAAERERAKVLAGEAPCYVHMESEWLGDLAKAFEAYAQGDGAAGDAAREQAFAKVPQSTGTFNGRAFSLIADCDGRFGPSFEAIMSGRWGLIGFDQVAEMKSEGPIDLRDLVWLPVEISFRSGYSAAALLPVRYPGTEAVGDDAMRLAHSTEWRDGVCGQVGIGQHLWFVEDGTELDILSLRRIVMG